MNKQEANTPRPRTGLETAVIGMACRFPGADNIDEFWENLKNGVESITFFSDDELAAAGIDPGLLNNPNYIKGGGILENIEYFDAFFFGYSPREAEILNPQARIFLECVWEALENAGCNPESGEKLIGLYVGGGSSFYWEGLTLLSGKSAELDLLSVTNLANKDFLSTLISYRLDLKGPSIVTQTACSTSLTTIHLGCRAVLSGECHIALAGGVTVSPAINGGYMYEEGMILSPDGHCRAFDKKAKGMVTGNGSGIVVLKRLKNAIADRDYIYAVVKGSAVNNDGRRKVGYSAPSVEGQAEVIRTALAMARVQPESIGYVETHGTGTELGDPVEIQGLKFAFNTTERGFCAIGAVKSNMGHLDNAAGAAGFIKTVLALKHRLIPPSLHFNTPNNKIDFENSPFYVNNRLLEWKNDKYPLRAGVSAFGMGGSNTHIVLEEAPVIDHWSSLTAETGRQSNYQLILLSAKTPSALDKMTENLTGYFKKNLLNRGDHENPTNPGPTLADAAYTLQLGRKAFNHRRMIVCSTAAEAVGKLSAQDSREVFTFTSPREERPVVFMFSGLGAQYTGMGYDLYRQEPAFRKEVDRCFEILEPLAGSSIKMALYPMLQGPADVDENRNPALSAELTGEQHIRRFEIAQAVIFILEYALAVLLMKWGIKPHAMIGYSFGEYTAACLSGVLSLEDSLKLIVHRGRLINRLSPGTMMSIPLPAGELKSWLTGENELAIAVDNGESCIVSGASARVEALETQLKRKRCLCMKLPNSHALHSPMMDPILKEFETFVQQVSLKEPQIPYVSNLTGNWITVEEAENPAYWVNHLRHTVRFAEGVEILTGYPGSIFVEMGPGRELSALVSRYIAKNPDQAVINLVRHPEKKVSDVYYLLNKIGMLWIYGKTVDWTQYHNEKKRYRLPLPSYPFERQRFWIDGNLFTLMTGRLLENENKPVDFADWFFIPCWKRSILLPGGENKITGKYTWLVFMDECGVGAALVQRLNRDEHDVVVVKPGRKFKKAGEGAYTVNPCRENDYRALFDDLRLAQRMPDKILHLWGVSEDAEETDSQPDSQGTPGLAGPVFQRVDNHQDRGFYSLVYVAKAISRQDYAETIEILVVTDNMQDVSEARGIQPGKATVLGPVKVIPQEHPNIRCRSIDLILPPSRVRQKQKITRQLWAELSGESQDTVVALGANHRWIQTFEPVRLDEGRENSLPLRKGGVYLITGGTGHIGLIIAGYLAAAFKAKLILTGRSAFPPREEWDRHLSRCGPEDNISQKIIKVKQMEEQGAQVLIFSTDAAHREKMARVIEQSEALFGKINGVIHAAGIVGGKTFSLVQKIQRSECQEQFQAKVYGLLVLEDLFKDKEPDFFWVMSSISSVLGGLEFVAYAAANSFMDAYVALHNRLSPRPWISVGWDGMEPGKTISGFKRILSIFIGEGAGDINQVVVSTGGNLQKRIDRWIKFESLTDEQGDDSQDTSSLNLKARPNLMSAYEAPRGPVEKAIVDIWQRLFGFEQIGIRDDFLELGGDSLKAITIIGKIQRTLQVNVPISEFFQRLTIENLAQYIQGSEKTIHQELIPVEEKEYYRLSSAQKRFYVLQQMGENNTAYNISQVFPMTNEVNKERLITVFNRLIARHDTFRTSFPAVDGEPVQKIHKEVEWNLQLYKTDEAGLENIKQDLTRPFNLSEAPLLRVALLEIESASPYRGLFVDMHHIISDEVSQSILRTEFMALFSDLELPPCRFRYKDFSQWENSKSQQAAIKKQEDYWLKQLDGQLPVLNLPLNFPRPAVQSNAGCTITFHLPLKDCIALRTMARREGATLFMVLLTVYSIFLAKLCCQEDIIIGIPMVGRKHSDLQKIFGVFINPIALRSFPGGEKTVRDFLNEVKTNIPEAFENQQYPFEDLVNKVMVERDTGRNPIFDVMLNLLNQEDYLNTIPGDIDEDEESYTYIKESVRFDMNLVAADLGERIFCAFLYCTALFKPETVERFLGYFKKIVSQLPGNLDRRIADIEIISETEKQHLLLDFNAFAADYPRHKAVIQLFEEQVRRTPDNVALVFENNRVTYRQLDEQANRLGRLLRSKGAAPDTLVSLMVQRSIEMVVGIWGILKSGCAYLPVSPEVPEDRITYMLDNASVNILLTQEMFIEKYAGQYQVINLNSPDTYKTPGPGPGCINVPTDLAYVIYTSGSTGKPKGVMIQNRSVINIVKWFAAQYDLKPGFQLVQMFEYTFDASINQIFGSLLHGVTLHVIRKEYFYDIEFLRDYIVTRFIHLINFVQSVIKEVLCGREKIESLKYVISGAEKLKSTVKNEILDNGYALYNQYGPTEVTVDALAEKCSYESNGTVGVPVYNAQCYIVNAYGRLNPVGVAGELWVGGDGLARGYISNVELTMEKFVPNPFIPGTNVYRTGDLTRWLPAGNVEFLGRIDTQVKIRGFRIEPVEIANHLVNIHGIKEAVVIDREDTSGETYLCAYLVGQEQESAGEIDTGEIKNILSGNLPNYMVPLYYVRIPRLPLSGHGKLIRSALPEPGISAASVDAAAAPGNDLERKLLDIWAEVLNIDRQIIGVDSDFFELGGHSLRAARLTARIHKELHVKLPLAEVFKTPMIRGMAQYIQGAVRQRFQAVEPEPKADYYDVSNAQRRLWVLEQFAEAAAAYIMTDWYIFENLNRDAFEKALKTMVKRHEAFRTTFIVIDGEPKQKINHDEECGINIQYMDLKEKQDREKIIDNVLAEVATKPFNLEKGPLLRVKLLYLPGNRCFFAAAMHHIISDGWSMRILRNEVLTLYTAYCHHKENPLPPLRIQYKDFTAWQNRQLQGEALAIHQGFWQECFKDEIPVLNLETDFPRPPVKTYNGSFLDIAVDRETHNGLNVINKKYNTTFIMTLTALLTALLHRYTGQEDIVIGLPVSGRNHSDLENQVGFYINMLPLRVRFKTTDTFENLLNTVKNAILAAFEHQVYPFDLLVEDLGFDRDKSRSPLFDVVMQYVNFEGIEEKVGVEVEGAKEEIRSVLPENNNISMGFIASKFDLVFNFYQAVPLNGSITYNTDIFEKQGIVIMIERLKVVMREIAANPLMRLDQLEFETGIEKEMKAAVESTTFDFG